jgi:hypothetical protein
VAGHGDNYEAIAVAVGIIGREVKRRRQARADGQRVFTPVHVVMDEVGDVFAEVPEAKQVAEAIARRGAKLNMHLTLGCQDRQVKTLGLEGKSKLLENLREIHVMRQGGDQRVAVVGDQTILIPPLPDPEAFIRTRPRPAAAPAPASDDLLNSLLAESVLPASGRHQNAPARSVLDDNSRTAEQNIESVLVASGRHQNDITVTVNARAEVGPARRRTGRKLPNVKAMAARDTRARLVAAYQDAGTKGETFRKAADRLGGDKTVTFPAWQSGRAERKKS